MKRLILLIFLAIFIGAKLPSNEGRIKTAIYWLSPIMSESIVPKVAKFDLAIIDIENAKNNRQSLDSLKKLNPAIKLIAYFNSMEEFQSITVNRPLQNYWMQEVRNKYPQWLLKTGDGKPAIFYPGMIMINLSADCPRINGQNYGEWMASKLVTEFQQDSLWSGCFVDNCNPAMSWNFRKTHLDADNDGRPDDDASFDKSWLKGYRAHLEIIRKGMGQDFIMIGNKGILAFMDILNGRMFEGFPNDDLGGNTAGGWWQGGWWQCLANAYEIGKYTIFQAKNKEQLDFTIASALLLNDRPYVAV